MSKDLTSLLSETIFIPLSIREWTTADLLVSERLWNVLQRIGYRTLSELHGKTYKEIYIAKNCGRKTIIELKNFVTEHLSDDDTQELSNLLERKRLAETLYIPQEFRGLPLAAFPIPTRLLNVLRDLNFRLVGDLHGFPVKNLKTVANCGSHTISELKIFVEKIQQGEFDTKTSVPKIVLTPQELNLAQFINFIDSFLEAMPPRDKDILGFRFGAAGRPLTLEEVGGKYGVSRERIRQIQNDNLKLLKNRLGQAGENLFEQLNRDCLAAVCPLTSQLLVYWARKDSADFRFSPSFYVRLLAKLSPEILVLAEGQINQGTPQTEHDSRICQTIKGILSQGYEAVPLGEMFEQLRGSVADLKERDFLEAIQFSNYLALTFDAPDKPSIKLTAKRRAAEITRQVLSQSDCPLTPEEIIERAQKMFGDNVVTSSPHSLNNLLYYAKGFYLLDNRAIGLRKHFRLPPERWSELKDNFFSLLKENNRSFSTSEVISRKLFSWAEIINSSEAAEILREDDRFTDLGRFHFALAEWDVEEREMVTDLIVKVLRQVNHPLNSTDIGNKIQNFRSITPTSMSSILQQHKAVEDYGCGFYGLKEWNDKQRFFLVSNKAFVNRAVARSEPPLTFGDLCRKLEIAETGALADKLWRTLSASPKLRFKPNNQSPETILVHTQWRLERAVQKVLAQAEHPLSIYRIQWDLKETFGATFDDKKLDSIKNCLDNDELFVRNPQGEFLLNEQIDQDDVGAELLRQACLEILKEENVVLSADVLLEKLEVQDLTNDKLSAEMLAALLRGDADFQEIGMNSFRATK